ncbi:hypothetical protein ACX1DX_09220 [Tessaracoccus sp. Y36]
MRDIAASDTVELLQHLHETLAVHFGNLRDSRYQLGISAPVFALEHDLSHDDLALLKEAVREAIRRCHLAHYQASWLPFVVYAAEMGYGYAGEEYWTTFSSLTPRWTSNERSTIRDWFMRFHQQFRGARPAGAWANQFTIIAWPITHAVLPTYLQRHLAHLLFEFRGALTSDLLDDPEGLGTRLARRASGYPERFRVFCQNTALVGQVAVALLSGDREPTPYLSPSTLARIVESLSQESRTRHWLKSARGSARLVRGFRSGDRSPAAGEPSKGLPRATDPRLFLRYVNGWAAFAELPDLSALVPSGDEIHTQLRMSRATVDGGGRPIPPSGLLYPGQEVRLARWPRPDEPFLQLERGDAGTNAFLAALCAITKGPWWLFRCHTPGLAVEVRGKFVRPGHHYVLIGSESAVAPRVPWCEEAHLEVSGVKAYEFLVPPQLCDDEEAALLAAGISVVSHVGIRPVGLVASSWDGEGEVEWLAGEPAMLGVRSDLVPNRARVVVGGSPYVFDWAPGEAELLFTLEGLSVGSHQLDVTLLDEADRSLASGTLVATIRDPRVRPEGGAAGEGIRLLATPNRPTMAELWDQRAVVTVDGPLGAEVELNVNLLSGDNEPLAGLRRTVRLPVEEADWRLAAKSIRTDARFTGAYDGAESCVVTVVRDGIGFATLTCERGFQPLRWRFTRNHDGQVLAALVDRTDGGATSLEFYDVEAPLTAVRKDPAEVLIVPPRGGLSIATTGDEVAAAILPTDPNALIRLPPARPIVTARMRTSREVLRLVEGHQRWISAELPADAFAAYQIQTVSDAITRAIGTLIGGNEWAAIERKLTSARDHCDHLEGMVDAVGSSREHRSFASAVARNLYKWLKPEQLLVGFHDVIGPHLAGYGFEGRPSVPRFLLTLAGRPGYVTEWESSEAVLILDRVFKAPVLYRAARFAVLGTRALNDAEDAEWSF